MAQKPQPLAELTARAEAIQREARQVIAAMAARAEHSRDLIERSNELIERSAYAGRSLFRPP